MKEGHIGALRLHHTVFVLQASIEGGIANITAACKIVSNVLMKTLQICQSIFILPNYVHTLL
jgi:hypothetical protein